MLKIAQATRIDVRLAQHMVRERGISVRVACEVAGISQTCYRYVCKRSTENDEIADWLMRLTDNPRSWGGRAVLPVSTQRQGLWFRAGLCRARSGRSRRSRSKRILLTEDNQRVVSEAQQRVLSEGLKRRGAPSSLCIPRKTFPPAYRVRSAAGIVPIAKLRDGLLRRNEQAFHDLHAFGFLLHNLKNLSLCPFFLDYDISTSPSRSSSVGPAARVTRSTSS